MKNINPNPKLRVRFPLSTEFTLGKHKTSPIPDSQIVTLNKRIADLQNKYLDLEERIVKLEKLNRK